MNKNREIAENREKSAKNAGGGAKKTAWSAMLRHALRGSVCGIGIAFAGFCIAGVVFDISGKGYITFENWAFTKMAVGCFAVGLGFGIPSAVYENDSLPMLMKVLIHMGTGCAVYTAIAFAVGWLGHESSAALCLLSLAGQLAATFAIWLCFYMRARREVKLMNEKLG